MATQTYEKGKSPLAPGNNLYNGEWDKEDRAQAQDTFSGNYDGNAVDELPDREEWRAEMYGEEDAETDPVETKGEVEQVFGALFQSTGQVLVDGDKVNKLAHGR